MKLTKRMKSAIIQASIVNVIIILVLIGVIGLFIIPKVLSAESVKTSLSEVYTEYHLTKQEGVNFYDLQGLVGSPGIVDTGDVDVSSIMRNITADFYTQNFSNSGSGDFMQYLDSVEKKIIDIKSSEVYIEQDKKLDTVLPVYTSDASFQDDNLTDFHFTNFIENLIYSFNLSVNGQIGVGELQKLDQNENESSNQEISEDGTTQQSIPKNVYVLGEDIFKIPMKFDIEGQKSDIVDFVHYFENVGSISLEGQNLEIYNDKFITKTIEGEQRTSEYNIYENQIADIEYFEWSDYPDSSTNNIQGSSLLAALKGSQAREKASGEIKINFYVAGVPGYRMEKFIKELLADYAKLSSQVAIDTQRYTNLAYSYKEGKQIQAIAQLQSLNNLLIGQKPSMEKLQISLAKKEDVQKLYEDSIEYRVTLKWIEQSYQNQLVHLNNK